jgi:hypothetical protein
MELHISNADDYISKKRHAGYAGVCVTSHTEEPPGLKKPSLTTLARRIF